MSTKREKIIEIQTRLNDSLKPENSNMLLNGRGTGDDRYLNNELTDLRLLGVKVTLPVSFSTSNSLVYYEIVAEILRQIEDHLHPVKRWFVNHIDTLIASGLSVVAIVISILGAV